MTDSTRQLTTVRPVSHLGRVRINPAICGVFILIVVLIAVGAIMTDRFATANNLRNVVRFSASTLFVSLGQTVVVLIGGIDLSVGAVISLAGTVAAGLFAGDISRLWWAVPVVLFMGGSVGVINALLIVRLRIHSLIATLGMAAILQGLALLYSDRPINGPEDFDSFAFDDVVGIPVGALTGVILLVCVGVYLRRTRFGRQVYAVGGNAAAARLVGLSTTGVTVASFAFCSTMAAVSGIYLVSLLGSGSPIMGQGYELTSITPVVLGGTILAGGKGGVFGTLVAVFLVSLLNNLLNFLDISTFYQWVIQGLIILAAVSVLPQRKAQS
jgi:ribose transport system permease protein